MIDTEEIPKLKAYSQVAPYSAVSSNIPSPALSSLKPTYRAPRDLITISVEHIPMLKYRVLDDQTGFTFRQNKQN
jgi:hypothetical protein